MKGLLTEEYGQLVKGLRRRPLTAKTRVRFPYWLLSFLDDFLALQLVYIYTDLSLLFLYRQR